MKLRPFPPKSPFNSEPNTPGEPPTPIEQTEILPGEFKLQGRLDSTPIMAEDSPHPTGEFYVWERPDGERVGVYEQTKFAIDGYPYAVAKHIHPISGESPYWKYTHIAETWKDAVISARHTAEHRQFIIESNPGETHQEWIERTKEPTISPSKNPTPAVTRR